MTSLRKVDPEAIADAWNRHVPSRYRVSPDLVLQNLLDSELLYHEASWWHDGEFIAIKRSAADLYGGPDPKTLHLSLFTPGLISRATDLVAGMENASLVVGMDSNHFLPGAPTDVPWMGTALKKHGFVKGGLAFDLERDLLGLTSIAQTDPAFEFRSVRQTDLPSLDAFLLREFPGRWRYDVSRKIAADGPDAIFALFRDDECHGFAMIQREGCGLPIGGAVWNADLGPAWGALGPIGVSQELRGGGQGSALLNAALIELQSRGARRTIIDWTELLDFYGTQGFSVSRSYRSYRYAPLADRRSEG